MRITSLLFDAFLKCATKCHLRSLGEIGAGNEYAEWVRGRDESYKREAARALQETVPATERVVAPPATVNLKAAQWRLALDLVAETSESSADSPVSESQPNEEAHGLGAPGSEQLLESRLHAVERVPSEGRGKPAQFVPIRFVFRNKLTKDDRLLLAFDTLVLSQVLGRAISFGKIIHGDDHATLKVKTSDLVGEVRKRVKKVAALLSSTSPPDLVLNRHCAECEFQARCRKIAVEKDDLSLLALMSAKERKKLHSKGIFTVTQLSYTFRPRRRPKKLRDKREKYHHSLKALAIREKKIHIVGSPELKIEGTPVYLDVEGLPDRDFYYLIGLRIGNGESAIQHSLWADTVEDEGRIWREFLAILETVEKPVLIHYGSYESTFLQQMTEQYDTPPDGSSVAKVIRITMNLVSFVFAQVYFPALSNGLKEITRWIGGDWSAGICTGLDCLVARYRWEEKRDSVTHAQLVNYNAEDCLALQRVSNEVARICVGRDHNPQRDEKVVNSDSLKSDLPFRLGRTVFALPEFDYINKAAYWDYQREKIQLRHGQKRPSKPMRKRPRRKLHINETIKLAPLASCPSCRLLDIRTIRRNHRIVRDLKFGRAGVKRWIVKYVRRHYRCDSCGAKFADQVKEWPPHREGPGLLAYVVYQLVELRISQREIGRSLSDLFGVILPRTTVFRLKSRAAKFYSQTCAAMRRSLVVGRVLHIDETSICIEGEREFAWVLCNQDRVVFLRTETRNGSFLKELLEQFGGVLVTDFYAAYESIPCPQQKCLIHLIRDLNDDLLKEPFNCEMKALAREFGGVLRGIVDTIDRFGLKTRYLHKHRLVVGRFFRDLSKQVYRSETAIKYQQRFEKNRDTLFTFLDHDGVPWNNNTAEHAIKALATLRRAIGGMSTQTGTDDYLVLLSIYETCNYMGVSFLGFLLSDEKDIHAFAQSLRGRRWRTQTSQPDGLPPDVIPDTGSQP